MDNLKLVLEEVMATEVLSRAARRKKAKAMKKAQKKIQRAKKRNLNRAITTDKVEKKAKKMAINALKARINKNRDSKGDNGKTSISQKEREEKYLKKNKKKIDQLAKKFKKDARTNLKADKQRRKEQARKK